MILVRMAVLHQTLLREALRLVRQEARVVPAHELGLCSALVTPRGTLAKLIAAASQLL